MCILQEGAGASILAVSLHAYLGSCDEFIWQIVCYHNSLDGAARAEGPSDEIGSSQMFGRHLELSASGMSHAPAPHSSLLTSLAALAASTARAHSQIQSLCGTSEARSWNAHI